MKAWAICVVIGFMAAPVLAQTPGATNPDSKKSVPCASLPEKERRQTEACKTDEERQEDAYEKEQKERAEREKPTHSFFLKHLHIDGMWVPTQSGSDLYGLVGAHLTVANVERVYFFGPPGVMLITRRSGGKLNVSPGVTWGLSFALVKFRLPGTTNTAGLHANLVQCWTVGASQQRIDMAGFSLTLKQ